MRTLIPFLFPLSAFAQEVQIVPYADLKGQLSAIVDFEAFDKYLSPGTKLDGVQDFGGLSAAERFFGQYIQEVEGFDTLDGLPAGPLVLMTGAPGENLAVTFYFMIGNHLVGHAAPGYPENHAGGEGSIAILFDTDQRAFGFRVAAEPAPDEGDPPKGRMWVTLYDRAGNQIDRLPITLDWGRQGYGFERTSGQSDIAGFTIENRDPAGIAIDDVIFELSEPTS